MKIAMSLAHQQLEEEPASAATDLLQAALAGDRESLGLLLERHRPYVYARALQLTGSRAAAEDAVQDTFVIAITRLSELRKGESLRSWLYAVVTNVCLAGLRRQNIAERRLIAEHKLYKHHGALLGEEYLQAMVQKDMVWRAISGLGDELRLAVMLRYFSSYHSYKEIALILGVPVGTVRSRLAAAKAQLLRLLNGNGRPAAGEAASGDTFAAENLRAMWAGLWRGEVRRFDDYFTQDLSFTFIFADKSISTQHSLQAWQDEIRGDIEAGTTVHPDDVLSSANVCVVVGDIENAPETPFRCPPSACAVLLHDGRRINSMRIYMTARPGS